MTSIIASIPLWTLGAVLFFSSAACLFTSMITAERFREEAANRKWTYTQAYFFNASLILLLASSAALFLAAKVVS